MNFGQALEEVKKGRCMRLTHWREDVYIKAEIPTGDIGINVPCLYVFSKFGKVQWKETFLDIFSEKWEIVE